MSLRDFAAEALSAQPRALLPGVWLYRTDLRKDVSLHDELFDVVLVVARRMRLSRWRAGSGDRRAPEAELRTNTVEQEVLLSGLVSEFMQCLVSQG